jgi:predicted membrane protein
MTIDLSDLPLDGDTRPSPLTVEADIGFGALDVIVPADANVTVDAEAGMGDITGGPAGNDGGVDLHEEWEMDGEEGGGRVHLDLYVGMGELEVRRAAA